MSRRQELCRNFQRGSCKYGAQCRFMHASSQQQQQQQQAKPNPFGFGSGSRQQQQQSSFGAQFQQQQEQKPNPFGFGVQGGAATQSRNAPGPAKQCPASRAAAALRGLLERPHACGGGVAWGEALVMGYDEMGYELWKPYLRSMMEADMKSVSMGTKSKSEVLESCLQQMKACFLDARVNKAKLLDAMGTFFARSNRPINETQNPVEVVRPCGACNGSEMVLKRRATGEFMVGCRSYPQCRNVVWLPGSLSEAAVTNQVCPICAPGHL